MWDARKEIYSTGFMLERRYVTNQSLCFHFKTPGKEQQIKPKVRRKEIIKPRAEINGD